MPIEEKKKQPRLVVGGLYVKTEKNGIVKRRMVVSADEFQGDVLRYCISDQARRDIYFDSDTLPHEEFARDHKLVGRLIPEDLYAKLVELFAPAVDEAPTATTEGAPAQE
jgi:hypothetical protein